VENEINEIKVFADKENYKHIQSKSNLINNNYKVKNYIKIFEKLKNLKFYFLLYIVSKK